MSGEQAWTYGPEPAEDERTPREDPIRFYWRCALCHMVWGVPRCPACHRTRREAGHVGLVR